MFKEIFMYCLILSNNLNLFINLSNLVAFYMQNTKNYETSKKSTKFFKDPMCYASVPTYAFCIRSHELGTNHKV